DVHTPTMSSCATPQTVNYVILLFVHVSFFFNDPATTEIYTLSLHDALPICARAVPVCGHGLRHRPVGRAPLRRPRSEEHTSELQSLAYLVCRFPRVTEY